MEEKKSGRLQSLKLPRDLSLGLVKPKKQYTPNLNVIRNKDKPKEIFRKADQKRREKSGSRIKSEKPNYDRFVQSTGVFSQGVGESKPHSYVERAPRFRDSGANTVKPAINRNTWTVNKKEEDPVLDDLANCDSDSEDDKSFAPLTIASESLKKLKKEVKKEEVLTPEPFNCDYYNDENPALALVKLPDSFAGKGLSDDPNVKKLFDYPLKGMLEGQIGKLIIRKSGKMEVQIGSIKYELSPENAFDSKQQLATVGIQDGQNHIAILGNVLHNFVMFPDYESLLKKK